MLSSHLAACSQIRHRNPQAQAAPPVAPRQRNPHAPADRRRPLLCPCPGLGLGPCPCPCPCPGGCPLPSLPSLPLSPQVPPRLGTLPGRNVAPARDRYWYPHHHWYRPCPWHHGGWAQTWRRPPLVFPLPCAACGTLRQRDRGGGVYVCVCPAGVSESTHSCYSCPLISFAALESSAYRCVSPPFRATFIVQAGGPSAI